jgi:hypothetical protein
VENISNESQERRKIDMLTKKDLNKKHAYAVHAGTGYKGYSTYYYVPKNGVTIMVSQGVGFSSPVKRFKTHREAIMNLQYYEKHGYFRHMKALK